MKRRWLNFVLVSGILSGGLLSWSCGNGESGECVPDCDLRNCGDDGCGGSCGSCEAPLVCNGGVCEEILFDWVEIPGGTYMMGSPEGEGSDIERPEHEVDVPTFYMLRSEVTVEQYHQCVTAGVCQQPVEGHNSNYACTHPYWTGPELLQHPMNAVCHAEARNFCENWAGGRLPSEAEWEYAARNGGEDVLYPWGDEPASCEYAVMDDETLGKGCGEYGTWEACSKPAGHTTHGLCDMSGNVAEWVQDCYHDSYDGAPADGSAWPEDECPGGPAISARVIRGGGWYFFPSLLLVRSRLNEGTSTQSDNHGFRCAKNGV